MTGFSEEQRTNMQKLSILKDLYFQRLRDFIPVSLDTLYENSRKELEDQMESLKNNDVEQFNFLKNNFEFMMDQKRNLIERDQSKDLAETAKDLFETYKKDNNFQKMVKILMNVGNYELIEQ
jgi:hypothetical protein